MAALLQQMATVVFYEMVWIHAAFCITILLQLVVVQLEEPLPQADDMMV